MWTIHDNKEVEAFFCAHRIELQQLRLLRNDFYKKHVPCEQVIRHIPEPFREEFCSKCIFHPLRLIHCQRSRLDGSSKLVFEAEDGCRLETVILRARSGRVSLCLSSQIGCAAGCKFCATGQMGFRRQLSAAEILDQVAHANRILAAEGLNLRNVVFMGMGEPFHNEENLYQSLEIMLSPKCFDLSPKRIMISTIGIPQAMLRFAARHSDIRLGVSVHSARQAIREHLMPLTRQYGLGQLRETIKTVGKIQQQDVMVEYMLLEGVTDTAADVVALRDFIEGIPVWVNLLVYNPVACAPELAASSEAVREHFADQLKMNGVQVTTRKSLGRDIAAACGQLVALDENRGHMVDPCGCGQELAEHYS